jgi:ATP-dependent DNA helicase RecQ
VPRRCQACDNCLAVGRPPDQPVSPEDARRALSAAARFSGRVGAANLAAILGGRETAWTRRNPWLGEVSHFGALPWPEARLRVLISEMVGAGLVEQSAGEYPVLQLTPLGASVLRGQAAVELALPADEGRVAGKASGPASSADPVLLERLRRWRLETSQREGVPAYVVFHDRTLQEIAARRPASPEELAAVSGVGPAKLERYGAQLLDVLESRT